MSQLNQQPYVPPQTTHVPPSMQQPLPSQYPDYITPSQKGHVLRNVLLVLAVLAILGMVGCMAVVGAVARKADGPHTVTMGATSTSGNVSVSWSAGSDDTYQDDVEPVWRHDINVKCITPVVLRVSNPSTAGPTDTVTCTIVVDGQTKSNEQATGANAVASCSTFS